MPEAGMNPESGPRFNYDAPKDNGGGGGVEGDAMNEWDKRDRFMEQMNLSPVNTFLEKTKKIDLVSEEENPEKKKIEREKLVEAYVDILHSQIDVTDGLNDFLEKLENPFYDTRWSYEAIKRVSQEVENQLREPGIGPEGKAWLKRLTKDLIWHKANFQVVEAMGIACDFYYDGELQMRTLRTMHRKVIAKDFVQLYQKELKGLSLSDEEKGLINKTIEDAQRRLPLEKEVPVDNGQGGQEGVNEKQIVKTHYSQVAENEKMLLKEGLREEAISFQDDADFWRKAIAFTDQWDHDFCEEKPLYRAQCSNQDRIELTEKERDFIIKLFAEWAFKDNPNFEFFDYNVLKDGAKPEDQKKEDIIRTVKVPNMILNRFRINDTEQNYEKYHALIEQLLLQGALDKLTKIQTISDKAQAEIEYNSLLDSIKEGAERRLSNYYSPEKMGIRERLAETILKTGIYIDLGLMSVGELGWGWSYEKDEKTGQISKVCEIGSPYNANDVQTVMFWAYHNITYDNRIETRSNIIPATVGSYREKWEGKPPFWKPSLADARLKDDILNSVLKNIETNGYKDLVVRKGYREGLGKINMNFGEIDPKVLKFISDNIWAITTPNLNSKKGDYLLSLPIFLPTRINELNFWRTIALSLDKKALPNELNVWKETLGRKKLSDFNWELMKTHAVDWYHTNNEMMFRFLSLVTTPHSLDRDKGGEFNKFFSQATETNMRELIKRNRLAWRGSKYLGSVTDTAIIPMLIVLSSAYNTEIFGPNGDVEGSNLNEFDKDISWWINTCLEFTDKKGKVNNFGKSMASLIFAYSILARRVAKAGGKIQETTQRDVIDFMTEQYKKYGDKVKGPNPI